MSILIRSLTYGHPGREILFEHFDLSITKGEKAALVGDNGVGKSTLLQLLAGRLKPSVGELDLSARSWYVPQHLGQYDHLSVAQALKVDVKLNALRAVLEGDAAPDHFTDLEDDWNIEEKVNAAMDRWQLAHIDVGQAMGTLSGGEKTKLFLAGVLIHEPRIILLDEPTNHLDQSGRELLYELVTGTAATVLAVSHDRTLLNLLNTTFELDQRGIERFGGNYEFYREQKEEQLSAWRSRLNQQEKALRLARKKDREMAGQRQKKQVRGKASGRAGSLPRIVAGGLRSKAEESTARLREVHRGKMESISGDLKRTQSEIHQRQAFRMDIHGSGLHEGKLLIETRGIYYSIGELTLWPPLSFSLRSGDRIQITGPNGSGKTTLLKIFTGAIQPTGGEIVNTGFNYLYLDQDYTMIDPERTLLEQVQRYNERRLSEHELRSLLNYAQFPGEAWDRKCAGLSGGEKMKLSLCCLAVSNHAPDVLILDEPTNNLDMQSLEALTLSVRNFSGTLLVVSHDDYFIKEAGITGTLNLG